MPKHEAPASLVGADILNLVTTGMYHTPLAVYREYIQNCADAIEASAWADKGRIHISINPGERSVRIRDNGPGLTHAQAKRELIPIARSRKRRGVDRGFRGIGRLSGLAFADKITFRTRASRAQLVTEIAWNGSTLRAGAVEGADPGQIIQDCVEVGRVDGTDWPEHFFEVEIHDVARHAAGRILNREAVRSFIGEVCPVPMSDDFPFTKEVEDLFATGRQPLTLEVMLDGESEPIRRRLGAGLTFAADRTDAFVELQLLRVPATDSDKDAAIGWVAHSSYLGAIPKELGVRGIRLREGNIQIGGDDVFDPLFREERFNRWCVGELHVVDERLLPNGRRDYYEPSPHMRQIENHLESVIQRIVSRCRGASIARNHTRRVQMTVEQTESAYELAGSGYLKAEDARALIERTLQNVRTVEGTLGATNSDQEKNLAELIRLKTKLAQFRPRRGRPRMGNVRSREIATYQRVFGALTELSPSPSAAKNMIEGVLAYAGNPGMKTSKAA